MNAAYLRTVQLLLTVAPEVFHSPDFALKGGTALNLFVQDMPRLSVDLDLVFVRHELPRDEALGAIGAALSDAKARLERQGLQVLQPRTKDGTEARLLIRDGDIEVKVEVNFVFRGTVMQPVHTDLTPAAQSAFAANVKVPVLATAELYGGKLVAALDRQHPRDLFDVMLMLERFGLPESFVDCFVIYLAGHDRPVHEVLFAPEKPIDVLFEQEFVGMTTEPVALAQLKAARETMFSTLPRALTVRHRDFLLSLTRAEPDWTLLPFAHAGHLPALRWKLENLGRLRRNAEKFKQQHSLLREGLERLDP
ncbi:MAG: nucleotidyl transferase AbiEii/AbiGii toxin family protein [Polaromonas sp.]|uniref:nucleotidyl transferase AbiEii/AbiGii toxin family protein n=1 Tax=Polaromonas sp. TaxID=1869339 RepID=UPI002733ADCF|nr:nucleotidyl transferase AbiEii/AbiGii toxin family protein [Polaromonas sp.]MDP3247954.1 nucleotidyl transferase AbiEii/AbiGii toxin family protein [Polaromonas sp.]